MTDLFYPNLPEWFELHLEYLINVSLDASHLPQEQMEELKDFIGGLVEQYQIECYGVRYGKQRCA